MIADIKRLSETIAEKKNIAATEPDVGQLVMKRGEAIQALVLLLTPERLAVLPPELSRTFQAELAAIQAGDVSVNQAFVTSMEALHEQLVGLRAGQTTLRGYHVPFGNQESYTRSNEA